VNTDPKDTVVHAGGFRTIDIAGLRARYTALMSLPSAKVSEGSAILSAPGSVPLPKYYTTRALRVSDLNSGSLMAAAPSSSGSQADALIAGLNAEGYWPTLLSSTSNPYVANSTAALAPGEFRITRVGDASDTSPYLTDYPKEGISTGTYIHNMGQLIEALGG
jgi:hypothetical protein